MSWSTTAASVPLMHLPGYPCAELPMLRGRAGHWAADNPQCLEVNETGYGGGLCG